MTTKRWRLAIFALTAATVLSAQSTDTYFEAGGEALRQQLERLQPYWKPHIENSRRGILEAADQVRRKQRAIVLGAGNCIEIPLEDLALRFEEVILVDLDQESIEQARARLPQALQAKVRLETEDVSTFAVPLMDALKRAVDEAATEVDLYSRLDAIHAELPREDIEIGAAHASDLVVSSLLLAEIPTFPHAYLDRLIHQKFRKNIGQWPGYAAARERLQRLAARNHFALLGRLARPEGVIYFADTVAIGPGVSRLRPARRLQVMDRITELLAQLNLFALAADSNEALTRIQSLFRGDERTREEFRAMLQELDKSPDSVSSYDRALSAEAALGLVCGGVFPVESEIELYERQLAIYSQTAPEAMDQTMPAVDLASVWREQGLEAPAAPRSWWWLDHVCLPSGRWMGFEVRSWVFWPHRAQR